MKKRRRKVKRTIKTPGGTTIKTRKTRRVVRRSAPAAPASKTITAENSNPIVTQAGANLVT